MADYPIEAVGNQPVRDEPNSEETRLNLKKIAVALQGISTSLEALSVLNQRIANRTACGEKTRAVLPIRRLQSPARPLQELGYSAHIKSPKDFWSFNSRESHLLKKAQKGQSMK